MQRVCNRKGTVDFYKSLLLLLIIINSYIKNDQILTVYCFTIIDIKRRRYCYYDYRCIRKKVGSGFSLCCIDLIIMF